MFSPFSIEEVNKLSSDYFIKIFGNVVEHYPAAAIGILKNRPFSNTDDISDAINYYLDRIHASEKEKILRLHPDLAGKLADLGKLTQESYQEQKASGLDKLSIEDKRKLNLLNEKYKCKFGFPAVVCAKENKAPVILSALAVRLYNEREDELMIGIEEVKKISKLRILDIVRE